MVDIHSIVASSHPSHRVQETEREITSRSQAGRSRCVGGHSMATTAATATQHQRSAGMVRTPPPAVGVKATLVTARQLLNNAPLVHTSPSAVEQ
jgi:prephenate dehydrogenase